MRTPEPLQGAVLAVSLNWQSEQSTGLGSENHKPSDLRSLRPGLHGGDGSIRPGSLMDDMALSIKSLE